MSVRVANSRFITSSLQKSVGFYQQILRGVSNFQELGNRLVKKAEALFYLRQVDSLKEFGLLLSNLPIKEYQLIGQYYLGWCEYYNGANETRTFEDVVENSTAYRPNALMSLAAIEARKGNSISEAYYFTEAIKYATSITTVIKAAKGIAIVKAKEGLNKSAIKDLENLIPIIRYAEPVVYFNFLNSYAVELIEAGRIEEATNISRIVLASPYTFAYPEWRETEQESALRGYKSRSVISFRQQQPENLLRLPDREPSESIRRSPFFQPSDVTQMAEWKKKMGKKPNGDEKDKEPLNDRQMVIKIMEYATDDELPDEVIYQMLEAVKKISNSYKSKKGDDKD